MRASEFVIEAALENFCWFFFFSSITSPDRMSFISFAAEKYILSDDFSNESLVYR